MKIADLKQNKWYEIPVGYDWVSMLPSWTYAKMVLNGQRFKYEIEMGNNTETNPDRTSRNLAIKIDNQCKGLFYYRDITSNHIQFGHTKYSSIFEFEFAEDLAKFEKLLGE